MRWRTKSSTTSTPTFTAPEGLLDVETVTEKINTPLPSSARSKDDESISPPMKGKLAYKGMQSEKLLVFGILVVLSSILATLSGTLNVYYKKALNDDYEGYGKSITQMIALEGVETLLQKPVNKGKLKRLANGMIQSNPDIASLHFYDASHHLLYGLKRADLSPKDLQEGTQYSVPLRQRASSKVMGQVVLTMTGHRLQDLLRISQPILIVPFASAWLLTVLVIMVMTYVWMKQLELIVNAVQRLSKGEFGVRLPAMHFTGLQRQLAEDINEMSRRLKIYEDHNIETILFERRKLEASLQSIVDGVIVCGHNDEVVFINDAGVRLLDLHSPQESLGRSIIHYQDDHGGIPFASIVEAFKESLTKLPPAPKESDDTWFMKPFSQVLELRPQLALQIIVAPLRQATRTFKEDVSTGGYVLIMHNITREREVDKLKTGFISNVSHELRTPVTTIKSYVDTLFHHRKDLDAATQDEFFETLHVETERLKKLVNDILDFSRLDEGQVELERAWEPLAPLISLTLQSVKVLAQHKQISLSTAIDSDLPPVYIHNDSMERVMLNLLSNAIKYTPEAGRVKVTAELTEDRTGVKVSIQDTGIGISPQHVSHVFDRFYRVENKVHTVKGTGLGLHLVKITIEKHHGGQVFVHSQEGKGSTFGFILPLKPNLQGL
jgi:two-component system sensor histidine kinase NblS